MYKFFALAVVLIQLSTLAVAKPLSSKEKPLSAEALKQYQACDHTSDCVRITNGCCDCANGGDTASVHRKFEKKVRDLFPCDKVMCTQKAGDCNFWIPACKAGLCTLVPPKKNL